MRKQKGALLFELLRLEGQSPIRNRAREISELGWGAKSLSHPPLRHFFRRVPSEVIPCRTH